MTQQQGLTRPIGDLECVVLPPHADDLTLDTSLRDEAAVDHPDSAAGDAKDLTCCMATDGAGLWDWMERVREWRGCQRIDRSGK